MHFECSDVVAGPGGLRRELCDPFVDRFPNRYVVLAGLENGNALGWRTNETSLCPARSVLRRARVRPVVVVPRVCRDGFAWAGDLGPHCRRRRDRGVVVVAHGVIDDARRRSKGEAATG